MPLEVRTAGQSITVAINMFMNFVITQAFLPLFCHLGYTLFFVFAVLLAAVTLFVALFLPETKGGAHRGHGRRLGEALVLEALRPHR
jgi:MFS transporter, SP family, sugar:H+ symporter